MYFKDKLKQYTFFLVENPKEFYNYLIQPKYILNLLFDMFNIRHRLVDLRSIVLYATSVCNSKCLMCDIGQQNKKGIDRLRKSQQTVYLKLELLNKLLNDPYIKKRKLNFRILMTEPLLHPDISEVVKLIKSHGHYVNITTNGYLLPDKAKDLALSGLDAVQVSLDASEKLNDSIRGVEGIYRRAIDGLKILDKEKVKIIINYTVSCLNDSEILNFLDSINKEGIKVDQINFQLMDFVSKEMMNLQNEKCEIKQSESCISEIVNPAKVNAKELSKQLSSINHNIYENILQVNLIPPIEDEEQIRKYFNTNGEKLAGNSRCVLPWHQLAFTTDGKILIHMRCFDFIYGDFTKKGIKEIFLGDKINDFRKKLIKSNFCFPACTRCCGVMKVGNINKKIGVIK